MDLSYDKDHIWHPYTSMIDPLPVYGAVKTHGVRIELDSGEQLIDGMASWWSAIHGYNHPDILGAIKNQLDVMPHVMFGGLTHEPAIQLCKTLANWSGLDKVFLADSGSVAVEVALKMAIQYWHSKEKPEKNRMLAISHSYHGDTFGAMSVCDPQNSMHSLYTGLLPEHFFVSAPSTKPEEAFPEDGMQALETCLEKNADKIAALILEPVVQGAGGMRFYHPEFVRQAKRLCEQYQVLLIADEIATGFGRTGKMFACQWADVTPDILCLGKALTGGTLSFAATLCTSQVAKGISEGEAGVLMHGPTFMGNPLACAAANASLALLESGEWQTQVANIEAQLKEELAPLSEAPGIVDVRVFGAIGVVEMQEPGDVAELQRQFIQRGVWIRPFGKLVYIMPPFVISAEDLSQITSAMVSVLPS